MLNLDFRKYISGYIKKEDKVPYMDKAKEIRERFINGDLAYFNKLDSYISKKDLIKIVNLTDYIRDNCDIFVVVGVGGSFMGSKAVIEALSKKYEKSYPEVIFMGHDLCSESVKETIDYIKDKDIIVNVISKSGGTLEPNISFSLLMDLMNKKYKDEEIKNRIIVTTDPDDGKLRSLANEKGYVSFDIPKNIGGRFSVLTAVGLLPISVAGFNAPMILEGAMSSFNRIDEALQYAIIRDIFYNKNRNIEAFTVYNDKLYYFTEWLKQLFSETEGKDGKGIFPVSLVNTRDLHSFGQYLQEGKDNVFESVIGIKNDVNVPLKDYDMELNTLNNIALEKVSLAHYNGHTPSLLFTIDNKDEKHLGMLIHFFIVSSIMGALLLDVNPFGQPGVEEYKRLINEEIK